MAVRPATVVRTVMVVRSVAMVQSVAMVTPVTVDLVAVPAELVEQVQGHRRVVPIGTIVGVMAPRVIMPAGVDRLWRDRSKPNPGRRAAARAPGFGLPAVDGQLAFELAARLARRVVVSERRRDLAVVASLGVIPEFGLTGPVELERVLNRLLLVTPVGLGQQRIGCRRCRPHRGCPQRQNNRDRQSDESSSHWITPMCDCVQVYAQPDRPTINPAER